jgi:hypothetical protein
VIELILNIVDFSLLSFHQMIVFEKQEELTYYLKEIIL